MSLQTWTRNPLVDDFMRARDEMGRLFSRMFVPGGATTAFEPTGGYGRLEGYLPPVDISESDDGVVVRAEIPGIAARDLDISVTGSTLTIAGRKEEQEECEREDYYRCERRFGSFRRTVDLPESADPERISADSENGIVTVRFAKKPGMRSRRVEIKPTSRRVTVQG
jgi:HSP20 family protein